MQHLTALAPWLCVRLSCATLYMVTTHLSFTVGLKVGTVLTVFIL